VVPGTNGYNGESRSPILIFSYARRSFFCPPKRMPIFIIAGKWGAYTSRESDTYEVGYVRRSSRPAREGKDFDSRWACSPALGSSFPSGVSCTCLRCRGSRETLMAVGSLAVDPLCALAANAPLFRQPIRRGSRVETLYVRQPMRVKRFLLNVVTVPFAEASSRIRFRRWCSLANILAN